MITAFLALLSGGWAAALASAWILPGMAGLLGLVIGWCDGDWRLALIAAATLAGFVAVWRTFGLKPALAALAAGALVFARRSGERTGAATQAAKEKADADRNVQRASAARADADRRNADPGRLRNDDGFRRD
ncbi:hypothetical protein [Xanthobacter sp. ZOL 2024]